MSFEVVGNSAAARQLRNDLEATRRDTKSHVLLLGPTGSGKERIAQWIHEASRPKESPFVSFVFGAFPEQVADAELFGHERGAFTGSIQARKGAAEEAAKGTLFLDEIGDLPLGHQPKLLRLLEAGKYRRLGKTKEQTLDARVISATHQDLDRRVQEGKLREDLYHRLHCLVVRVPSLDARREDIPAIIEDEFGEGAVSTRGLAWLSTRTFPGNIRELKNVVTQARAKLEDKRPLDPGDFTSPPPALGAVEAVVNLLLERGLSTAQIEEAHRLYIRTVVERHGGNMSQAAKHLGMSRGFVRRACAPDATGQRGPAIVQAPRQSRATLGAETDAAEAGYLG